MQVASDALRAALDSVFRSPRYAWRADDPALATVARWWRALLDCIAGLRDASPLGYRIFIASLVVVLLAIIGHALWVLARTIRGAARAADSTEPLAPVARRDAAWYIRNADALAAEGRYADALQRAFIALALTLDRRGLLSYHPSRTPAEVAREARVRAEDRERLRALVRTLYAAAFGGAPCGPADYRAWRALADQDWHAPAH